MSASQGRKCPTALDGVCTGGELIFSTSDPVMQEMIAEGEWDHFLTSSFPSPAAANDVRRVNSVGGAGSGLPFHGSKDATLGLLHGAKH